MSLTAPPILSTPESHIFDGTSSLPPVPSRERERERDKEKLTDEEFCKVYEIQRTARELLQGHWGVVALQFPDDWLRDAGRVVGSLERCLGLLIEEGGESEEGEVRNNGTRGQLETDFSTLSIAGPREHGIINEEESRRTGIKEKKKKCKFYILADTSYGACCVDEIAASHVDAEVVVHYGRSCLSPTARLPVIYVFTSRPLDLEPVVDTFENTYASKEEKVVLMGDIIYHSHLPLLHKRLLGKAYTNILVPEVVHDPASLIPNRRIDISEEEVRAYSVFHISDPPPALLLTLSSRVGGFSIYHTPTTPPARVEGGKRMPTKALQQNTRMTLRRRYALVTSLSTCPIFGILINTLSVQNYLQTVDAIRQMIASAGKKSYTFVVGKVNAAKIANFAEIGGWVAIGCWESSLIESAEFYRPIITPFELQLALKGDQERVWAGDWRGDFAGLDLSAGGVEMGGRGRDGGDVGENTREQEREEERGERGGEDDSEAEEEDSAPPEFDLRTGRYISHSRPMRNVALSSDSITNQPNNSSQPSSPSSSSTEQKGLIKRAKGELAAVNGVTSPGAEFLRSQRTWVGLGSDFDREGGRESEEDRNREGASVEEGRRGVARGYVVGEDTERR